MRDMCFRKKRTCAFKKLIIKPEIHRMFFFNPFIQQDRYEIKPITYTNRE